MIVAVDEFPSLDLSLLTERQRDVLHLRYSCCLSWRGIGTFLSIDHMVAKRHHDRAIERLRTASQGYTSPYKVEA